MLAAMFSGRHTVHKDSDTVSLPLGYVFVDRDGTHFRHILNWLRDGVAPNLFDLERLELLREAEYYQLLGLVEMINMVLNKKKVDEKMDADLTRTDIIKCLQSKTKYCLKLRGVNLSGLDLSNLVRSYALCDSRLIVKSCIIIFRAGPRNSCTLFELENMCPWALTKLDIGLTKGLNLMPKGLIPNLNHKNSFVKGPMLVFVWVYPI
ncbi:putative potassium channel tetramerization-type BTB domain, SKP1/BTB/POZ domain superfamily [Helianthus annuus]|uniref:Potassium channel tetramerization-type BTB domain, SKP1/BTB/POZ domain superfamily n=1 Tax=Helianthus annuus TaxID=4232 RepID=A0A9K3N2B4_HELAN|nr:putative potassium channel tetramerization-type BTB domain, SKP1/BTB/POZ domain superfamily [Helianthus annuus]KAJ0503141.1 putative chromatin remodeling & transcription regulator BTB-POZ family [Helianthus annuus]KAJ0511395.1 putative chromatin remodeling & transcription regulator BTB-POZ family [Helianthus annuus]KAJ0519109.1 putative chromatin remodeling & transcription regulator BTB-POZ family [Helianthus annuus]KAJ0687101.1 putative chromatin remodeling & transcription regulator BTB-POZ